MRRLLIILTLACLFSCKKDNSSTPSTKDRLSDKKWQPISITAGILDLFSKFPPYEKDDYIVLKSDLTYELNANTEKAPGTTESVLDTGTWELTNSDKTIILHSNNTASSNPISKIKEFQIQQLTDTSLTTQSIDSTTGTTINIAFKAL